MLLDDAIDILESRLGHTFDRSSPAVTMVDNDNNPKMVLEQHGQTGAIVVVAPVCSLCTNLELAVGISYSLLGLNASRGLGDEIIVSVDTDQQYYFAMREFDRLGDADDFIEDCNDLLIVAEQLKQSIEEVKADFTRVDEVEHSPSLKV